jgi:hypothetical protein
MVVKLDMTVNGQFLAKVDVLPIWDFQAYIVREDGLTL